MTRVVHAAAKILFGIPGDLSFYIHGIKSPGKIKLLPRTRGNISVNVSWSVDGVTQRRHQMAVMAFSADVQCKCPAVTSQAKTRPVLL